MGSLVQSKQNGSEHQKKPTKKSKYIIFHSKGKKVEMNIIYDDNEPGFGHSETGSPSFFHPVIP
jgi:hypothetical protein